MSAVPPTLEALLIEHRDELIAHLARTAKGLAAFESAEDLAHGVHLRALADADRFEYRGREAFRAWMWTVARRHVAERNAHWNALNRGSAKVVRLSFGQNTANTGVVALPASATGPSTFADRREVLVLATKALTSLPRRDMDLVRWRSEGLMVEEQTARLGLGYAAAQRAGLRALERFQSAFELVLRASVRDAREPRR